mmetsp:Transcript_29337/g.95599  ORF Transcript_29337/g.95599 Transcript_29337/m.95599 type:complete len:445 (-) Transcript_29337:207-1541(-)
MRGVRHAELGRGDKVVEPVDRHVGAAALRAVPDDGDLLRADASAGGGVDKSLLDEHHLIPGSAEHGGELAWAAHDGDGGAKLAELVGVKVAERPARVADEDGGAAGGSAAAAAGGSGGGGAAAARHRRRLKPAAHVHGHPHVVGRRGVAARTRLGPHHGTPFRDGWDVHHLDRGWGGVHDVVRVRARVARERPAPHAAPAAVLRVARVHAVLVLWLDVHILRGAEQAPEPEHRVDRLVERRAALLGHRESILALLHAFLLAEPQLPVVLAHLVAQAQRPEAPQVFRKQVRDGVSDDGAVVGEVARALGPREEEHREQKPRRVKHVRHLDHEPTLALGDVLVRLGVDQKGGVKGGHAIKDAAEKESRLDASRAHRRSDAHNDCALVARQQLHSAEVVVVLQPRQVGQRNQKHRAREQPLRIPQPRHPNSFVYGAVGVLCPSVAEV